MAKTSPASNANASKASSVAAFLAAAFAICPICIPSYVAILSSVGLGVLVRPTVARAIIIVFMLITVGILIWNRRIHKSFWPLLLAVVGGFLLVWFRYGAFHPELITLGTVLVSVATVMDYYKRRYAATGALNACPVE